MKATAVSMALALCAVSCKSGSARRPGVNSAVPGASASARDVPLPPLRAERWLVDLPVPGFAAASVAVPLGAREARPLVIALHGRGDRPEWQCGTWIGIAEGYPFVLCPRGKPAPEFGRNPERYTYAGLPETEAELRSALRALKRRFGPYIAKGPVILAGYSLGAIYGARIAHQEPSFFARLVLVEGGYETWSAGDAAVFSKNGGQKLLVVCSQSGCERGAERAVLFTNRARVDAEFVYPGPFGHVLDGRVARAIKPHFAWLVSGDSRWPARSERGDGAR